MDATKPEPALEQEQGVEGRDSPKATPEQAEKDSLIPETQPDAQELPEVSPAASPEASLKTQGDQQGQSAPSTSENQTEAPTAPTPPSKVSFPSVRASTLPTDGHFGVVSSNGQLVCEFKRDDASQSPPPEEKIVGFQSSNSEPKTLGGSVSPPPQGDNRIEVAPMSSPSENGHISTLELSVDHESYPEVYIPGHHDQPPPPPARKSPQMGRESPATTYATSRAYSQSGYLENNHMSMRHPIDVPLVTPLHLLGDQSDTVDCPFCLRRVETTVKKTASKSTHTWGIICFFTTVVGAFVPYWCDWKSNVEHHCKNCNRKVAQRSFDAKEFEPLGTQPELREVSRFEPAKKPDRWGVGALNS